jgi:hypothetical protein
MGLLQTEPEKLEAICLEKKSAEHFDCTNALTQQIKPVI